jgi:hypothetical protein
MTSNKMESLRGKIVFEITITALAINNTQVRPEGDLYRPHVKHSRQQKCINTATCLFVLIMLYQVLQAQYALERGTIRYLRLLIISSSSLSPSFLCLLICSTFLAFRLNVPPFPHLFIHFLFLLTNEQDVRESFKVCRSSKDHINKANRK